MIFTNHSEMLMYKSKKISITLPVLNEEKHIAKVVRKIPSFVDYIIIINDGSTDNTLSIIENLNDSRIHLINHEYNLGVGKSTIEGHLFAIELGSDILVRIDGDGQMDSSLLTLLLDPHFDENVQFTKGDRISMKENRKLMPIKRLIGNKILSFLTRIITGYWKLSDSQNGYTALQSKVFKSFNLARLKHDYIFENSVLFELSLVGAKIKDIEMKSVYEYEISSIKMMKFIISMIKFFFSSIFCRIKLRLRNKS